MIQSARATAIKWKRITGGDRISHMEDSLVVIDKAENEEEAFPLAWGSILGSATGHDLVLARITVSYTHLRAHETRRHL
eukprot:1132774-Prorocentrum_lima.AAC.1